VTRQSALFSPDFLIEFGTSTTTGFLRRSGPERSGNLGCSQNPGIFWIPAFAGMTVRAGCLTIHSSVECVMHDALREPAKQLRFSKMPRECGCEEADKSPLPALAPP
jgi:hypothetical protein